MRIIDCYYIIGKGKASKCYKIHGVGIAYNVSKGMLYCKGLGVVSSVLSVSPLVVCLGLGLGQGFVSAAINFVKNGVI